MKRILYLITWVILISIGQYYYLGHINVSSPVITDLITFFSIAFGFYVTSLSILATSKYAIKLHKVMDTDDPSKTLLQTLVFKFKLGLTVVLFTLCYLILIQFRLTQLDAAKEALNKLLYLPLLGLVTANMFYSIQMLIHLIRFIQKNAEESA